MSMLHTVNKSPYDKGTLTSCLHHVKAGDSILLIEDAVVAALSGGSAATNVRDAMTDCAVYVLSPDYQARGLPDNRMIDGIKAVDYTGFVDLVTENDKVQSWL